MTRKATFLKPMSKADPGSEVIEPYDIPTGGRGRDAEDLHCGLCAAIIFTGYSIASARTRFFKPGSRGKAVVCPKCTTINGV
jgi:hypothetical protein